MVVFFPFERPVNPFLNEIENYFTGTFIFDHYSNLHKYKNVDIIHLHWPEILFESKLPTQAQFEDFLLHFNTWKAKYKIVYTLHNVKPHLSKLALYNELYSIICNEVDAVVHFANASKNIFKTKYPESKAKHYIIDHPLYMDTPNTTNKKAARDFLKINEKYKVVLVFGQIRTKAEREFIFKTFKNLKVENKFLLVTSIGKFRSKINLGWKVSNFVNQYLFKKYNAKSNYAIKNATIEKNEIQYYFKAADLVLIPRLVSINSGVIYLASRFNTKVVASNYGNIGEVAQKLNQKVFNVNKTDKASSILKDVLLDNEESKIYDLAVDTMHPKIVAAKHLELYNSLVNE